jgi:Arc/MetJ family transcription regulator
VARITVDVNEEWLAAARDVLGTDTKVATINAALRSFAVRKQAAEIVAAFDSVAVDLGDGNSSWGYGGGRDLARLEEDVHQDRTA